MKDTLTMKMLKSKEDILKLFSATRDRDPTKIRRDSNEGEKLVLNHQDVKINEEVSQYNDKVRTKRHLNLDIKGEAGSCEICNLKIARAIMYIGFYILNATYSNISITPQWWASDILHHDTETNEQTKINKQTNKRTDKRTNKQTNKQASKPKQTSKQTNTKKNDSTCFYISHCGDKRRVRSAKSVPCNRRNIDSIFVKNVSSLLICCLDFLEQTTIKNKSTIQ